MSTDAGEKQILLASKDDALRQFLKIHFPDHEVLESPCRSVKRNLEYIFSVCDGKCNLKACLKRASLALIHPDAAYVICRPILADNDGKSKYGYWLSYMRKNADENKISHLMNPSLPCIHQYVDVLDLKKEIIKTRGRRIKAAEISAFMKRSAYNLSKIIKSITGVTLKAFQGRVMLCHALHELFLTNKAIKEIAYDLNMHPNAFRTAFKRHFGVTPRQIRIMRAFY